MNLPFKHTNKKITTIIVMLALVFTASLSFLATPQTVQAFPWGGQFSQVIPCWNKVIWVKAGPHHAEGNIFGFLE